MHVAYYISAHGYGHGVRSCDIIRALCASSPSLKVTVVSDLPETFFQSRLPPDGRVRLRRGAFDVGMVQRDAIRVDVDATLDAMRALTAQHETLVAGETAFLRETGAAAAVADIPGIPLRAAREAGRPAIAVGNFCWNWIYAPFAARHPAWGEITDCLEADYRCADLLLRLPFHGDMSVFETIEDIGLVGSPGRGRREELASRLDLDARKTWVLLAFTSLDWETPALDAVEGQDAYEFLALRPFRWRRRNLHTLDPRRYAFSDVVASVDVVVSKPGFGIVSECILNGKPLVYADRPDFVEYPVLVEAINRYVRHVHLPSGDLYAGRLAPCIERLGRADPPSGRQPAGGDRRAAARILQLAGAGNR